MVEKIEQVGHLRKVSFLLRAGRSHEVMDIVSKAHRMEFIFGIAPTGLTPFEHEMAGRRAGDTVNLAVDPDRLHEVFGHLGVLLPELPAKESPLHLEVYVEAATEAGPREVIRAMAELAACGDHCCGG